MVLNRAVRCTYRCLATRRITTAYLCNNKSSEKNGSGSTATTTSLLRLAKSNSTSVHSNDKRAAAASFSSSSSTSSSSPSWNNTSTKVGDGPNTQATTLSEPSQSQSQSQTPLAYISGQTTHFGFENVFVTEKEAKVREVFESVAESYDVMNDLMSAGLHRLWKDELVSMTGVAAIAKAVRRKKASSSSSSSSNPPLVSILDVAGGTGDVAFRFLEAAGCPERALSSGKDEISVTVCDINAEMLRVGERRAMERYGSGSSCSLLSDDRIGNGNNNDDDGDGTGALQFVQGDAQRLPFDGESFDLYTIAFGLRNVTDVDMALRDAVRVLKPGGRFLCLEFSRVPNPVLAAVYDAYSFNAIPAIGEAVTGDRTSYQYLVESIRKFCDQKELKERMEAAGFVNVSYTNMTGGVVAMHSGWKPF